MPTESIEFGCSECLCIAIESHRPELLQSLLQRTGLVYRDIYWVPAPREWVMNNLTCNYILKIPVLYYIQPDSELSFVGRENCGHMQIDAEICSPLDLHFTSIEYDARIFDHWNSSAYILVSLPLMAHWHSSDEFDAEQMLRQSGRFDHSEPQFFHTRPFAYDDWCCRGIGPLNLLEGAVLRCEFEVECQPKEAAPVSMPLEQQNQSSLPQFVLCEFDGTGWDWFVTSLNGKLSRLVYYTDTFPPAYSMLIDRVNTSSGRSILICRVFSQSSHGFCALEKIFINL